MMTQPSRNQRMSSVESVGSNTAQSSDGSKPARKWKPFECRVNLPALLNDPTLPKRPLDIFTQIWGPDFERRVPHARTSNGMSSSKTEKGAKPIPDAYLSILQRRAKKPAAAKPQTNANATQSQLDVPRLFLSTDFKLEDPETFCTVFQLPFRNGKVAFETTSQSTVNANTSAGSGRTRGRNDSGSSSQPLSPRSATMAQSTSSNGSHGMTMQQFAIGHFRSARSTIHEQLAHHLDAVETRIVAHVSRKSSAFFSAITAHDDVARTLERAALVTARLRAQLTVADRRAVAEPLQLARIEQRRARYARLLCKLKRVSDVAQSQAMIQVFLSRNEYAGALELIEVTRDLLHGELGGLSCFRHVEPQFVELLRVILRMMQAEFVSVLQLALRQNSKQRSTKAGESSSEAVLQNGESRPQVEAQSESESADERTEQIESKLGALLLGLIATRSYYAESFATAGSDMLVTSPRHSSAKFGGKEAAEEAATGTGDVTSPLSAPSVVSGGKSGTPDTSAAATRFRFVGWYREECCTCIRTCVKEAVVSVLNDDAELSNLSLSVNEALARVGADQSVTLIRNLLSSLHELLIRASSVLQIFVKAMNEAEQKEEMDEAAAAGISSNDQITSDSAITEGSTDGESKAQPQSNKPTSSSFDEFPCMRRALRNAFLYATTYAEERAAKIIQSQLTTVQQPSTNADTRWSLVQYFALLESVDRYLSEASHLVDDTVSSMLLSESGSLASRERERHESSPPSVLLQCVRSLSGRFVSRFHDDRRQKLSLILDSERWRPAEVPAEFQLLASHVISTQQLTTLASISGVSAGAVAPLNGVASPSAGALDSTNGHSDAPTSAVLVLDGEEYTVVGTVLILLRMMCEYGEAAQQLNFAAHDFLSRLLDLLKLFNSRTCQLILGAGAVQVAQLKTITTRNLALASRCLQLVIRILPIARKHFAALLDAQRSVPHGATGTSAALAANAANQLMRHTDSLRKDYDDHVGELANKIVGIMDATLQDSLAKWAPPFATASPGSAATVNTSNTNAASNSISAHVKTAAKQLLKMHETLVGVLPDLQIAAIYRQVYNDCFIFLLRSKLQAVPPPQRSRDIVSNVLQLDVTYLCDACKSIPFLKDVVFERVVDDLLAAVGNR